MDNYEKILESVAIVYSDFGYPEDMKSLVYYLPLSNGISSGVEGMVRKISQFLIEEKERVVQGIVNFELEKNIVI